MSQETYQQLVRYEELEAIICGQMYVYMNEGKALKAARVLRKIRHRMEKLCPHQPA